MTNYLSIDPGSKKCGVIIADIDKCLVLEGKVVYTSSAFFVINSWIDKYNIKKIILGNGTSSKYWNQKLRDILPILLVEEYGTSLKARDRYFEIWPLPRLIRWFPKGLIKINENLDAVAALIILEKYLGKKIIWKIKKNFKTLHAQ
tara:strand:- start:796 stop:1233 length:438 start_codon:yes stop_codon:yes gene_type:complete